MTIPVTIEAGSPFVFVGPPAAPPVVLVSPPGPAGVPGGTPLPARYELIAVSAWTFRHDFPYDPDVQVIVDGERVYIGTTYADSTHVTLSFPTPFSGSVILR